MALLRCSGVSRNHIFENVDWFKIGSLREIFSVCERLSDSSKLVFVFDAPLVPIMHRDLLLINNENHQVSGFLISAMALVVMCVVALCTQTSLGKISLGRWILIVLVAALCLHVGRARSELMRILFTMHVQSRARNLRFSIDATTPPWTLPTCRDGRSLSCKPPFLLYNASEQCCIDRLRAPSQWF